MSYAKYALEQFRRAAAGLEVKPVFQRAYQAGTRLSTIDEAEAYVGRLLREDTTYFDIEATGKDPAARLLSLSYAEGIAGQPQTLFAKLEQPRTSLDPYIRHKILPGVEESFAATPGAQYLSEREVAEKYLEHIESRAGGALAGWNIGYHPRRLSELGKEFSEYDVPMMLEAWERHGLLERGEQALSNVHLIDIGQEFRFEIAGKLARSGIDTKSWTAAQPLISSAKPVVDTYSNAVEATAKQTAGWGQAFLYESTFGIPATRAHISSADVGYLQQLTEEYVSGSFQAGFHPETYIRQMTEPGNIFLRLRAERKQFEQLHQAQPLRQRITQKDWLQLKARQTTDWIREHPWHVGVPAAGIAVWAMQPGRLFSGRDDEYNTLEGLRHGGAAQSSRKSLTEFGSGYVGLLFKGSKNVGTVSRGELISRLREGVKKFRSEGGSFVKGESPLGFLYDTEKKKISLGKLKSKEAKNINLILMVHELSEKKYADLMLKKGLEPQARFSSHISPGVIADEAILAAKLGQKEFNIMRGFRELEVTAIQKSQEEQLASIIEEMSSLPVYKKMSPEKLEQNKSIIMQGFEVQKKIQQDYIMRVKKIYASVEKKWIRANKDVVGFSWERGRGNNIEGLSESGVAKELRHLLTDHGSSWDIIRSIARGMGMTYESLLNNRSFHTALQEGRVISKLGEGKFGKAYLMRSSFEGHEFSYVRKDIAQRKPSTLPESAPMMMLANTETVPTPYLSKSGSLFMEHMPGKPLYQLNPGEAKMALESNIEDKLVSTIDESTRRGIINEDIHNANIMFDPRTKRTSWIDWGLSYGTSAEMEHALGARSMRSEAKELMDRMKIMAETGQWPARSNTSRTAESTHRRAVSESTANGKRPGRRHTSKAGRIVS